MFGGLCAGLSEGERFKMGVHVLGESLKLACRATGLCSALHWKTAVFQTRGTERKNVVAEGKRCEKEFCRDLLVS